MAQFQKEKQLVRDYFDALDASPTESVQEVLRRFWNPLKSALGSMQRRQDIFIAGNNEYAPDEVWVMSMGYFMGNFFQPLLNIQPTGKLIMLRYTEFNCVQENKITKTGLFVDLVGFMEHAGVNPLPPQIGQIYYYPGPRDHNGLLYDDAAPDQTEKTIARLKSMLNFYAPYEAVMDCWKHEDLAANWEETMLWCGTAGAGYTIPVFQEHQKDFRRNLKDREGHPHVCRFAEGSFAGFFGWPNLTNTPTGGYLGYPGTNVPADMVVVDVYYVKNDKLSENWVIADVPYWLSQYGVDVFANPGKLGPQ